MLGKRQEVSGGKQWAVTDVSGQPTGQILTLLHLFKKHQYMSAHFFFLAFEVSKMN